MSLGSNIKKYRTKLGLTEKELAEKLNITTFTLSKIEKGDARPSYRIINDLCQIFSCMSKDLFDEDDENKEIIKPITTCFYCGKELFYEEEYETITLKETKRKHTTIEKHTYCTECMKSIKKMEAKEKIDKREQEISKRKKAIILGIISLIGFAGLSLFFILNDEKPIGYFMLFLSVSSFTFFVSVLLKNNFLDKALDKVMHKWFESITSAIIEGLLDEYCMFIFKILLIILIFIFEIIVFIILIIIFMFISIFVFPFAIKKSINETKMNIK